MSKERIKAAKALIETGYDISIDKIMMAGNLSNDILVQILRDDLKLLDGNLKLTGRTDISKQQIELILINKYIQRSRSRTPYIKKLEKRRAELLPTLKEIQRIDKVEKAESKDDIQKKIDEDDKQLRDMEEYTKKQKEDLDKLRKDIELIKKLKDDKETKRYLRKVELNELVTAQLEREQAEKELDEFTRRVEASPLIDEDVSEQKTRVEAVEERRAKEKAKKEQYKKDAEELYEKQLQKRLDEADEESRRMNLERASKFSKRYTIDLLKDPKTRDETISKLQNKLYALSPDYKLPVIDEGEELIKNYKEKLDEKEIEEIRKDYLTAYLIQQEESAKGQQPYTKENYMGPGTPIITFLLNDIIPVNNADKISMYHDAEYLLSRTPIQVEKADKEFLYKQFKSLVTTSPHKNILGIIAIGGKLVAETIGVIPKGSFGGLEKVKIPDSTQMKLDDINKYKTNLTFGERLKYLEEERKIVGTGKYGNLFLDDFEERLTEDILKQIENYNPNIEPYKELPVEQLYDSLEYLKGEGGKPLNESIIQFANAMLKNNPEAKAEAVENLIVSNDVEVLREMELNESKTTTDEKAEIKQEIINPVQDSEYIYEVIPSDPELKQGYDLYLNKPDETFEKLKKLNVKEEPEIDLTEFYKKGYELYLEHMDSFEEKIPEGSTLFTDNNFGDSYIPDKKTFEHILKYDLNLNPIDRTFGIKVC